MSNCRPWLCFVPKDYAWYCKNRRSIIIYTHLYPAITCQAVHCQLSNIPLHCTQLLATCPACPSVVSVQFASPRGFRPICPSSSFYCSNCSWCSSSCFHWSSAASTCLRLHFQSLWLSSTHSLSCPSPTLFTPTSLSSLSMQLFNTDFLALRFIVVTFPLLCTWSPLLLSP